MGLRRLVQTTPRDSKAPGHRYYCISIVMLLRDFSFVAVETLEGVNASGG